MPEPQRSNCSIHVLHCYRTYFPDPQGGLQEAIRQIALATHQQGTLNRIFALSPQPRPENVIRPEGIVSRAKSWMSPASCDIGLMRSLTLFSNLAKAADILHYHFPWPFADILHAGLKPSAPAVLTYHSDIVRQRLLGRLYEPLMWKMLTSMRAIVATSPAYAATSPVLSHPSISAKVHVIPLGIDEASYSKRGDETIFERTGLAASEPYFLFVGVLRYYKGLSFLIRAAKSVGARIVVVGSGPEHQSLVASASESGACNVVFTGQVTDDEKVALLRHCTALVLPSHLRSEAFGMVLVEAAMFGRPMISCEIGTGTSYVNLHGQTGIVVPPEDPDALATAMNALLRDQGLARSMGLAARKRYEGLYSGPAMGRAYAELYRQVLGDEGCG